MLQPPRRRATDQSPSIGARHRSTRDICPKAPSCDKAHSSDITDDSIKKSLDYDISKKDIFAIQSARSEGDGPEGRAIRNAIGAIRHHFNDEKKLNRRTDQLLKLGGLYPELCPFYLSWIMSRLHMGPQRGMSLQTEVSAEKTSEAPLSPDTLCVPPSILRTTELVAVPIEMQENCASPVQSAIAVFSEEPETENRTTHIGPDDKKDDKAVELPIASNNTKQKIGRGPWSVNPRLSSIERFGDCH